MSKPFSYLQSLAEDVKFEARECRHKAGDLIRQAEVLELVQIRIEDALKKDMNKFPTVPNATKLTCRRSSEAAEGTLPAQPVKRSG